MKTAREWAKDLWSCCAADVMGDRFDEDKATTIMADVIRTTIEECAKVAETPTDERMTTHPEHIDGCCGSAIAAEIRALAKP